MRLARRFPLPGLCVRYTMPGHSAPLLRVPGGWPCGLCSRLFATQCDGGSQRKNVQCCVHVACPAVPGFPGSPLPGPWPGRLLRTPRSTGERGNPRKKGSVGQLSSGGGAGDWQRAQCTEVPRGCPSVRSHVSETIRDKIPPPKGCPNRYRSAEGQRFPPQGSEINSKPQTGRTRKLPGQAGPGILLF